MQSQLIDQSWVSLVHKLSILLSTEFWFVGKMRMFHTPHPPRLKFPKDMLTPSCSSCLHKQVAPCKQEHVQALGEFGRIDTPSHNISAEVLLSVENVG